jgi:hypothetical protein
MQLSSIKKLTGKLLIDTLVTLRLYRIPPKPYSPPVLEEPNHYLTHDNGGVPYRVIVGNHEITIIDNYADKFLMKLDTIEVWIGESPFTPTTKCSGCYGEKFKGNSILVRVSENRYVFIGHTVYSFETKYPIVKYLSEVGNNDVPYPYAVDTENNFYLMVENVMLPVPEQYHNDPYGYHYGNRTPGKRNQVPGYNMEVTLMHQDEYYNTSVSK